MRRFQDFNSSVLRHAGQSIAVFATAIADQEARCLPKCGRFAQLLRHPGIGRMQSHPKVHYPPRSELDYEEDTERWKEEITNGQEVTSPDLLHMILEKSSKVSG